MIYVKREVEDLTGRIYSDLTVLGRAKDRFSPSGKKRIMWRCLCRCGNEVVVQGVHLKDGHTKSCGCLVTKTITRSHKFNTYDLNDLYGIGYTEEGRCFYFDIEDYEKIKDFYWRFDKDGYVVSVKNKVKYILHRFVMDCPAEKFIDHINHNKNDNRKTNLRIVTLSQNNMNKQIQSNNTSGVTGVAWHDKDQRWLAYIKKNRQTIRLGEFISFDEAVAVRKAAEDKYFGEYSYDNSINR